MSYNKIIENKNEFQRIYQDVLMKQNDEVILAFKDLKNLFYLPLNNLWYKDVVGFNNTTSVIFNNINEFNSFPTNGIYKNIITKDNILTNVKNLKSSNDISYLLGVKWGYFKHAREKILNMPKDLMNSIISQSYNDKKLEEIKAIDNLCQYFIENDIVSEQEILNYSDNKIESIFLLANHFTNFKVKNSQLINNTFPINPKTSLDRYDVIGGFNLEYYYNNIVTEILKENEIFKLKYLELLLKDNLRDNSEGIKRFYQYAHGNVKEAKLVKKICKLIESRFDINKKYFLLKESFLNNYLLSYKNEPYFNILLENIVSKAQDSMDITLYLNRLIKNSPDFEKYDYLLDKYNKNILGKKSYEDMLIPEEKKIYTFKLNLLDIFGENLKDFIVQVLLNKYKVAVRELLPNEKIEFEEDDLTLLVRIIKDNDEKLGSYVAERLKLIVENNGSLIATTDSDLIVNLARKIILEEQLDEKQINKSLRKKI
jgi:hypothetical protein